MYFTTAAGIDCRTIASITCGEEALPGEAVRVGVAGLDLVPEVPVAEQPLTTAGKRRRPSGVNTWCV